MAKKRKTKTKSAAKKGARKTKRRKKKKARAASRSSTANAVDDCSTGAGASRGAVRTAIAFRHRRSLRRQGASARQGYELRCSSLCGGGEEGGGRFPHLAVDSHIC